MIGLMSIQKEKQTAEAMIRLYCRLNHGGGMLCTGCEELLQYAQCRLDKCPFGDGKPTCRQCPIHCYRPDLRARMTAVMRFSGPRMTFRNPLGALRHLFKELFKPKVSLKSRKPVKPTSPEKKD